ncbi:TetR/AcrR family transcriptional regulator [Salipiger abyssi]|uniref:TetR/AcrR family transcriptional regulator n=1 Tax=Salipiger abyssi TaxID=1250539 RepID=UPI001A8CCAB8|nr:TetR/AcrR family transcriptional regulator [Salipiger abyssi]MBN9888897.1 TetR/AcrR family transcriptional regulator [Salipiger abyssi]
MTTTPKPRGKEATIEALLTAADALFGEKGPSAVSVREIAARANVNQALVHRHFGSKEALLDAIIEKHMLASKAALGEGASPEEALRNLLRYLSAQPAFTRTFAHLLLEQRPLDQFVRQTGGTSVLAGILRKAGVEAEDARTEAAMIMAFGFGWAMFRDLTAYAAASETAPGALDEAAISTITGLMMRFIESSEAT